tara:strand:+ start:25 stop:429 length:405 start_codon:yes stop_codon:yes gene_type:complete
MEDDFYATLKFKNGEEIFAKIAASEEVDRTMLVVHNPVLVSEIKGKNGLLGYKVEPWLKTTREDMFIINMDNILTLSESQDVEMIMMHQNFVRDSAEDARNHSKISRRMGYLGTVNDTKELLEKLYKLDRPHQP